MSRVTASSDPSKLVIPWGTIIGIIVCKGNYKCKSKSEAIRTLMHGLTLGISMDIRKDLDGQWVVYLSQMGVHFLRQKHGWVNKEMAKRHRTGNRRASMDIRHPKVKVRAQAVINDWVPGEVRRSDYTQEEIDQWTYGKSAPKVKAETPKPVKRFSLYDFIDDMEGEK